MHQNSACYALDHVGPALKPENMHHAVGSCLGTTFTNGGSSLLPSMHNAVEMSAHAGRIDARPNILSTQNSNMSLMQGINGGIIKSEVGYSGSLPYTFVADNSVMEAQPNIGDASVAPFSSVESSSQSLNEPLLDAENSSYGFLGNIPRNFSLSDLSVGGFSQSSGTSLSPQMCYRGVQGNVFWFLVALASPLFLLGSMMLFQ